MKKAFTILIFVVLLIPFGCDSSKEVNHEITSHEGEKILVGEIDILGLSVEPYQTWFDENYKNYVVDAASIENVDVDEVKIQLFLGTWCSDSQLQVPQFIKILNYLKYDLNNLSMIGLDNHPDRDLQSPQHEEEGLDIQFVPTFIFYRDGIELGRIVEYPEKSLEKDMSKIVGTN